MPFGVVSEKVVKVGVIPAKIRKLGIVPTYVAGGGSSAGKQMPKKAMEPVKSMTAQFEKGL